MPKYNKIENIPARVFFEILKTKNYQLLKPKPSEKDLEAVFISIYDAFFLASDNEEAKDYLRLTDEIAFLEYKIAKIKSTLHYYYYNYDKMVELVGKEKADILLNEYFDALEKGCDIIVDRNAKLIDEVQRLLTQEIGIINNDLSFAKMEYENLTKASQKKDFDYYESIGVLSEVLPNNALLKEEMTLAVYVTLEKLATKKVKEQQRLKK